MKKVYLYILTIILFFLSPRNQNIYAQEDDYQKLIDSLNQKIEQLQNELPKMGSNRGFKYFALRREIDQSIFLKDYYNYLYDEDLNKAKELVETKLERVEFINDNVSTEFYKSYYDKIKMSIKMQRMRYQALFEKDKNIKKLFKQKTKSGELHDYKKTKKTLELALKFAKEHKFESKYPILNDYIHLTEALIFDYNSEYDLSDMVHKKKKFENVFIPLVSSDSLSDIKEALNLAEICLNFSKLSKTSLNDEFFNNQILIANSAITDYYDRQGQRILLSDLSNGAIVAKLDSLNRPGVYKWHNRIIVINEFKPTYSSHSIKKGEAIIAADKRLMKYIRLNKIVNPKNNYKIANTQFIPYISGSEAIEFMYNHENKTWQYMICYGIIENESFTQTLSKFMPPLVFEEESSENEVM